MRFSSQELRRSFVDFFISKGHVAAPAASLVPDALSTTLFTIAGMEQFVPAFLGVVAPPAPRIVTVQRCLRVAGAKSDIENVGRTGRHGTFLEMLGNFSFGDYYKRDAIVWAWEYVTDVVGLDPAQLYVTVHTDDDQAETIWEREVGLDGARISRFGDENFWTMGASGPCGPSSEIFYDTGAEHASSPDDVGPNRGNRFVELWNLVFQQYNRTENGDLVELRTKNIDTGAGFERLLAIANGAASMYETDLFTQLVAAQPSIGRTQLSRSEQVVRRRIVADHARAATFLIADGVFPSNLERGYVLRFLIRRAILQGKLLGYPSGFMTALVPAVIASFSSWYPQLVGARAKIEHAMGAEELAFNRTLERGSAFLSDRLRAATEQGNLLSGQDVFTLHDTLGFPAELTREVAAEAGVGIDMEAFEAAMRRQRTRSRADAHEKRAVVTVAEMPAFTSEFTGYDGLETDGRVLSILRNGVAVDDLTDGEEGTIVLDRTSFYAERGGQIGDRGVIELLSGLQDTVRAYSGNGVRPATFTVTDTQYAGEAIAHHGIMRGGAIAVGDDVHAAVDPAWREEIRRHHTSVHLLQRALKDVVGDDIAQAGSWVGVDRMRFDFHAPSGALTPNQKREVVARVNAMIRADHHRVTTIMDPDEAIASGAIAMAGESYGERVRVLRFGSSIELCGGTHALTTGELGLFVMLSETAIGSGIRRIEAAVSKAAEAYVLDQQELVTGLAHALATKPAEITVRVERLQSEIRALQRSLGEARAKLAAADAADFAARAEMLGGKRTVAALVPKADAAALKELGTTIGQCLGSGIVALIGTEGGVVSLYVWVSPDLIAQGLHAGNLLKAAAPLVGGRGGGQASQAQGGGKNPSGAAAALAAIRALVAQ